MAVLITDRLFAQLLSGWAIGIVVTVVGLVASLVGDLSSGPLVIAAYAIALILVSALLHVVRASDRARAIRRTLAMAAAFVLCAAILVLLGRSVGARYRGHAHGHHHHGAEAVGGPATDEQPDSRPHPTSDTDHTQGDPVADFARRFDASDDPGQRADLVCEALQADPAVGADLALRYLAGGPPLFFAQTVVDDLDALLPRPSGFDVEQPLAAPVNQEAAARVRAEFDIR